MGSRRYFEQSTELLRTNKMQDLIENCGIEGYAVYMVLLEEMFERSLVGEVLDADEITFEEIASSLRIEENTVRTIVESMVEVQLISRELWQQNQIGFDGEPFGVRISHQRTNTYRKHTLKIFQRDGFRCVYCGATENLSLDHVIPQSRGGSHEPDNLACCCLTCNSSKGDRTPQEWRSS